MPPFFEPPPPPPELPQQPPRRPWHGAPDGVVGRTVALDLVLGRSEQAAIWIPAVTAYPDGLEVDLELRHRLDDVDLDHPFLFMHHHPRRRGHLSEEGIAPGLVRLGVEFADGRRATNLGSRLPFPGDPDAPPEGPVFSPSRGGGGGGGRWHHGFWLWPLPPPGPLAFVCEWPAAAIAETRTELDSAAIRAAAAEAIELWAEEAEAPGSSGGGTWSTLRMMGARATNEPRRGGELTVESEQKTQLVDITDRVRELVAGGEGSAVVVFVPHTTAGVVLQAAAEAAQVASGAGSSVTVPLAGGELALGARQRIFLCELDGPRRRRVRISIV